MKKERAVVIGGGFAGLVAAQVLAEQFKSVVIIEKDLRIGSASARSGAAQGAHLHVLLKRGQEILQTLFPGIDSKFLAAQCPEIDWAADTAWETRSGSFPRYESGMVTKSFSRPLLESAIYSLVSQKANISFANNCVEKIHFEGDRVSHIECADQSIFTADLFVMAGGQHFPIRHLMPQVSFEEYTESLFIDITYRSVVFETMSLNFKDYRQYYYQFSPPDDTLGAVISPIENGRCIATIIQYGHGETAKTDFSGFLKLTARVPGGEFAEILKNGVPLTDVSVFRKPTMYRRRLNKISNFPENVFAIGDVFCSLNPVFGQGMTVALEQALLLKNLLHGKRLSAREFHRKSAKQIRLPFLLSKLGSNPNDGFAKRYLHNYLLRCQASGRLHKKFLQVLHLKASYGALIDLRALFLTALKGTSND